MPQDIGVQYMPVVKRPSSSYTKCFRRSTYFWDTYGNFLYVFHGYTWSP